ncbi:alkaline phosphatase family protein [Geminocystis sp. GBBB08]|uniref:alkaline phosphatase family protein n=1 Tax=Geminocystis sp. GBBB08 TaxID=2604140 RepID=UPI0027E33EF7|nr:alkaline phosphatase family protein [Geminocystis sp. GBBB08]MBL1211117.1 hypothetical protein [Geminocystis sp. GBBB08]
MIIVIALDSADPDLISTWLDEEKLPFLQSLKQKGIFTKVNSLASILSDAPWSSFNTGVSPGKHGYYNFQRLEKGTTNIIRVNARSYCKYLPFWHKFCQTEQKIAVFDLPKTFPLEDINGVQITGWGGEYPLIPTCSIPEDKVKEITRLFGKYHQPKEIINPKFISQEKRRYNLLLSNLKQKTKAVKWLFEQDKYDLFLASFGEIHYGNHFFYHDYNTQHWAYNAQRAKHFQSALPNLYHQLDQSCEEILKDVGEDATIFVVSVHGISPYYGANHLMSEIMEKFGWQVKPPSQVKKTNTTNWEKFLATSWSQKLRNIIPKDIRGFINDRLIPTKIHDRVQNHQFNESINWQETRAFFLNIHFQGFIGINLKNREPYGIVERGEEYNSLCEEIIAELKLLINPDTNKPAIEEIYHISRLLQGESIEELPDIVFKWVENQEIKQLYHPKLGLISATAPPRRKTNHRGKGFLLATGKHINSNAQLSEINVLDFAPTLLYLLGQSIPEYMEGRILEEIISPQFKENNPIKYESFSDGWNRFCRW